MSEGLLYKKMRTEGLGKLSDEICTETCIPNLIRVLDKAKQDFPRVIFPDDADIKYFETAKQELKDVQGWFEKWFGDGGK